jgi:hypothetical protein
MTKPMPESFCKMSIIAKAAGIRNSAERLTCTEKRPAFQKLRGLIQTMEYINSQQVQPRAVKSFWT